MRRANRSVLAVLATIAVLAATPSAPARAAGTGGSDNALPADVTTYIDRRAGCNHWGGEEAYDEERRREIAVALKKLGCDAVEADEAQLLKRYERSPAVLRAIDQARYRDG